MSQENVSDKVRSLQRQIAHNIKFGQKPPSVRKSEGDEGSSDEEEVPRSPLRVMAQVESEPVDVEPQTAAHATPLKSPRSKRVLPPEGTIESINLDAVPQSGPRLDNAAAKHKLSVKPKNQRVSRKHRRITQELQEVDLQGILQEESDAQKTVEESGGVPDHSKKQRLQEDERDQPELRRKREMEQEEERLREEERKRAEELRLAEERRLWLEEERRQKEKEEEERRRIEEEERRRQEEEERLRRELEEKRRKEEEEFRLREEQERKMREEEEQKRREEERKREEEEIRRLVAERLQLEAERQRLEEEERIREAEEAARKEQEEAEKRRLQELEVKRRREEEEEQERLREEERRQQEELEEEMKRLAEEDARRMEEEEKKRQQEDREKASEGAESEWKRKAEEMRWKGMEERQPFTFKVSSGEKQILFQKVNLTPVTPGTGQQASASSGTGEGAKASSAAGAESPTRSSVYVPHTAILVTGAQLCGTAVNLDHIKDTACKSLLGLAEDKKAMGAPPTKTKTSPDRKSEKTKSLNLSSSPSDQSSAAVLAEWASIRSKIFKGVEEGKYEEYQEPTQSWKENQNRPSSEDLNESPFPHANLRKTLSASAKFSITPARKKFGDSNRNSEILCQDEGNDKRAESVSPEPVLGPSALAASSSSSKAQTRAVKSVRISDSSEECMFAKDLPSFLVPSPSQGSPVPQMPSPEVLSQTDSDISSVDARDETEQSDMGGDERPSPFGIKLRRTNYSLRFHNEQSTEKRKKRYSAGDSFDGVPGPLTPMDPGVVSPVFSDRASPTSPLRENVGFKPATSPSVDPQIKPSRSPVPSVRSEMERFISKPPVYQKPPTAPKPSDGATPPHSPLPKLGRTGPFSGDAQEHRKGSAQLLSDDERGSVKDDESSTSSLSSRASPGEEETKEKKSFFPSISIPWREKTDRKTELIRKEKPSLQSRHSLDSSKVQEKDKETGPLWITLALQKQKGFREQQQSREDRKNQREAKLAEKQARDKESTYHIHGVISSSEGKGNGNSTPPKPQTPEEGKRPDSLLGRFERRENLKKANTLPSSVTVEITDSTPSPPAVKEVSKRFPPGDSQQVSTEPAWLALAKRKAKAWSDCPQIIK